MARQILGGALAVLLILSDRIACVVMAIALIAIVRIVAQAWRPPSAPMDAVVRLRP